MTNEITKVKNNFYFKLKTKLQTIQKIERNFVAASHFWKLQLEII